MVLEQHSHLGKQDIIMASEPFPRKLQPVLLFFHGGTAPVLFRIHGIYIITTTFYLQVDGSVGINVIR